MQGSPETLYKLMILYMLGEVNHPLTNTQLTRFFLDKAYVSYFTLQRVLTELCDTHFVNAEQLGNSTYYELTDDGQATLKFFASEISEAAMADMDEYLAANKMELRNESMITADYYENADGNYVVHLGVRESKSQVMSIDITVPDLDSAEDMAAGWRGQSAEIYALIMHKLLAGGEKEQEK